jgi:hypothetical protein
VSTRVEHAFTLNYASELYSWGPVGALLGLEIAFLLEAEHARENAAGNRRRLTL